MKNVALHNLGCKVNSYEMDFMQQKLLKNGFDIVSFDEYADIYIVNTCTVTNIADRKSRQMLHRCKQLNPDAIVVAVGCYVQTDTERVLADSCIDIAIGNNNKASVVEAILNYLSLREQGIKPDCNLVSDVNDNANPCEYESMTIDETAEHTRAYIKIQDGCNQFCSYCIIPFARGRIRSRKQDEIIEEIKALVAKGYREVVLTGIHISSYGKDFKKTAGMLAHSKALGNSTKSPALDSSLSSAPVPSDYLSDTDTDLESWDKALISLLEQINAVDGVERIRVGSLEPRIITEDFTKRLASLEKICPHFHLSLQSGSDSVLKRMNRHYTAEEYAASVDLLRKYFDRPAITTDVIAGFPGETEEEFLETAEYLRRIGFYEVHLFPYSRRHGTVADKMPGQLTKQQKSNRVAALDIIEKEMTKSFRQSFIGETCTVLFEESKVINGKEYMIGHTTRYMMVAVIGDLSLKNEIREVRISEFLNDEVLFGEIV